MYKNVHQLVPYILVMVAVFDCDKVRTLSCPWNLLLSDNCNGAILVIYCNVCTVTVLTIVYCFNIAIFIVILSCLFNTYRGWRVINGSFKVSVGIAGTAIRSSKGVSLSDCDAVAVCMSSNQQSGRIPFKCN